jgi:alginate O-acetyltransferase complex protein AlgI
MNFISIEFAVFLSIVFLLLTFIKFPRTRKIILLGASCIFYGYWDWRFLVLLGFVTLLNYYISRLLVASNQPSRRNWLLTINIIGNLAFLGFFKYFNFFIDSLNFAVRPLHLQLTHLNIILPLGISFFTFGAISYIIDVYNDIAGPAHSLLDYAIFMMFFPRIISGPIVRASQFLPQLESGILINAENVMEGIQIFMRGMLKKMVIADNVAIMVDQIYRAPDMFSSATIWLGIAAYSIQIYCDFSGYTDMALGVALMLGFRLPQNFNLPYTSQSFTEFWSRWHITLSSWFRDYVFYPLEFTRRRAGFLRQQSHILLVFLLTGLWHGASWNFVLWGGLYGVYISLESLIFGSKRLRALPFTQPLAWIRALLVFIGVTLTWVPFRSPSLVTTITIYKKLFFLNSGYQIEWYFLWALLAVPMIFFGGILFQRLKIRWPIFSLIKSYTPAWILFQILVVYFLAPLNTSPFIYFRF